MGIGPRGKIRRVLGRIKRVFTESPAFWNIKNKLRKVLYLNLGGGPYFYERNWLNLEEVKSKLNPKPFILTPDCEFPIRRKSIRAVYTSHCLEHLNTPTVFRILTEIYRVLKDDGNLVVKIPDFDKVLQRWKTKDFSFFEEGWYCETCIHTWKSRQVPGSLSYRAAMIFCSFWNKEYGNPYLVERYLDNESAYYGPPVAGIEFIDGLMKNHTPSQISAELRKFVLKNEKNFKFSHQNAWSKQELETLLIQTGFCVKSFDKEFIIANCKFISGISEMKDQSLYCWAEKNKAFP